MYAEHAVKSHNFSNKEKGKKYPRSKCKYFNKSFGNLKMGSKATMRHFYF
jgi:hypothetical protein